MIISLLVVVMTAITGCNGFTIPKGTPHLSPSALKATERSYAVYNMDVVTPDGVAQKLDGPWYVVHPDFIKVHMQNQDDLLKTLQLLKDERSEGGKTKRYMAIVIALCSVFCLFMGRLLCSGRL